MIIQLMFINIKVKMFCNYGAKRVAPLKKSCELSKFSNLLHFVAASARVESDDELEPITDAFEIWNP